MIEIIKNRMESIIIREGEFCGTPLLHVQVCKRNQEGGWSRTGKGLSLRRDTWKAVIVAVRNEVERLEREEADREEEHIDELILAYEEMQCTDAQ